MPCSFWLDDVADQGRRTANCYQRYWSEAERYKLPPRSHSVYEGPQSCFVHWVHWGQPRFVCCLVPFGWMMLPIKEEGR
ncbi:MAG: hypothetical protein WCI02_15950, partial [Planctomycetota bacterium]